MIRTGSSARRDDGFTLVELADPPRTVISAPAYDPSDVIDEINVTTSPSAVGGDGPRLAAGAGAVGHRYELAQLAVDEQSFLYARWLRRRD